jgi:uncharacterized membrane protein
MTTLAFLASLAVIFAVILAIEADAEQGARLSRPAGLLTWLSRGNWPAKIGAALLIIGIGALLRYAALHIEIAAPLKLAAGLVLAFALGLASMFVPQGSARRAVSLALGGAAFGVAYLTAYSAFALFGYLSDPTGLALLGLTSVAAGVYAVTRSALSLALLSMIGAYLSPAFAVEDPGPKIVYGYYIGASLLTLVMVSLRGWRPLIHLSFLFTLAGGAFFAWTAGYYTPEHADVMLPVLLVLSAVHVAMPVLERGTHSQAVWVQQLDLVYMIALPAVAALLAYVIALDRFALSNTLVALGAIWALAAVALRFTGRPGAALHVVIAGLLVVLGAVVRFQDLPWELLTLAFSVGALAIAAWRVRPAGKVHDLLAGAALMLGAFHILNSLFDGELIARLIGAALLIAAGIICRRIKQSLDTLLLAAGIVWALIAIGIELIRWDLASFALVVHWTLLLAGASLWIPGRRVRFADRHISLLCLLILLTAALSAWGASETTAWVTVVIAPLVAIGMALRPLMADGDSSAERLFAALTAPAVAAIWAFIIRRNADIDALQFVFTIAALAAVATLLAGSLAPKERTAWMESASDFFGVGFAVALGVATLLVIERNPWAITLEVVCLAGLALVTWVRHTRHRPFTLATAACMIGLALILQANLMRVLGPPGTMNLSDVVRLEWSAVISLLWATAGMGLTLWSRRVGSRTVWVSGATLLVASAAKLLLVDFGSLGQLSNILAVIAAGVVFLLVGWLAPMPPAPSTSTSGEMNEDRQT